MHCSVGGSGAYCKPFSKGLLSSSPSNMTYTHKGVWWSRGPVSCKVKGLGWTYNPSHVRKGACSYPESHPQNSDPMWRWVNVIKRNKKKDLVCRDSMDGAPCWTPQGQVCLTPAWHTVQAFLHKLTCFHFKLIESYWNSRNMKCYCILESFICILQKQVGSLMSLFDYSEVMK